MGKDKSNNKNRSLCNIWIYLWIFGAFVCVYSLSIHHMNSRFNQITELVDSLISSNKSLIDSIITEPDSSIITAKNGIGIDMAKLKELIGFVKKNTAYTQKVIEESKSQINNDIDRLNFWIALWMGLFGVLAAVIPITLNITTKMDYDKLNEDINSIQTKVQDAETNIKLINAKIEAIEITNSINNIFIHIALIARNRDNENEYIKIALTRFKSYIEKLSSISIEADREIRQSILDMINSLRQLHTHELFKDYNQQQQLEVVIENTSKLVKTGLRGDDKRKIVDDTLPKIQSLIESLDII